MRNAKEFNEQAVTSFIQKVMERAANSFTQIAGMDIQSRETEVSLMEDADTTIGHPQDGASLCVLVTPLLGEIAGRSYLVLDTEEVELLLQKTPFRPSAGFDHELKEALLKEIDNIVSASMITALANEFKTDIYGDVPELLMLSEHGLKALLSQYIPNGQISLICSGGFVARQNETFAPRFIWKFSSAMIDRIEQSLNN